MIEIEDCIGKKCHQLKGAVQGHIINSGKVIMTEKPVGRNMHILNNNHHNIHNFKIMTGKVTCIC